MAQIFKIIKSLYFFILLNISYYNCYSYNKSVSYTSLHQTKRLYIFCVQSGNGYKFHRYMLTFITSVSELTSINITNKTNFNVNLFNNLNSNHNNHNNNNLKLKILQVNWDSKSSLKFLTKPLAYLTEINEIIKNNKLNNEDINDSYGLLVDSDILWSNYTLMEIWNKYESTRNNKPIVVSSELNCWIGKFCSKEDIQHVYFSKTETGYSSFINSGAIIGTISSLQHMLQNLTTDYKLYFLKTDKGYVYDDQYAFSLYARDNPHLVTVDSHQVLFGTFQIYDPQPIPLLESGYVCKVDESPSNFSYGSKELTGLALKTGSIAFNHKTCQIERFPHKLEHIQQAKSIYHIMSTLSNQPLLWHGNGGGKKTYSRFRPLTMECNFKKFGINSDRFFCYNDGCREIPENSNIPLGISWK